MSEIKDETALPRSRQRYSLNKNKYLLPPEVDRLVHILTSFKDKDPRNCTLLWLLLHTGGRAQEILNLVVADVNTYDQSIYVKGLKGSNDREIPIPPWLFARVEKLFAHSASDGRLFDISYSRLRQVWDTYRPVHKKLHALRHTFAIQIYRKTKDIRLVQVALGHRNIANTMVYAEYAYSQQELRRLIL